MQYIFLTITTILLACSFALQKVFQKWKGTSLAASSGYNAFLGLCTAIIFFFVNGFKIGFSWYSFAAAMLYNALIVSYTIIGFKLLKSGTIAMYMLFLMSGGMTVPYIYGLIFLDEPFSVLRTIALILVFAGVILSKISNEKINRKSLFMCIAVFIINGFTSVVSKVHQIESVFETVNTSEFILLGSLCKFLFAGALYLITKTQTEQQKEKTPALLPLLLIVGAACASGLSSLLQLRGAISLPATVLYPFITGGTIIASSVFGMLFFKEKLSKNMILSIILCFVGTLLFL